MTQESNFDRITKRINEYRDILELIGKDEMYESDEPFAFVGFEVRKIAFEIDQFVAENPTYYKKYLNEFLLEFYKYQYVVSELIESNEEMKSIKAHFKATNEPSVDTSGKPTKLSNYLFFQLDMGYITGHLENLLNIKKGIDGIEINKKNQKLQIKGKSKLSREQTALLFFYLRERQLISQPTNGDLAVAVSMLTGHSKKQIQDIIKSPETPAYQLGKDNNNSVTRDDFKALIYELKDLLGTIEKDYKEYSDKGELR